MSLTILSLFFQSGKEATEMQHTVPCRLFSRNENAFSMEGTVKGGRQLFPCPNCAIKGGRDCAEGSVAQQGPGPYSALSVFQ